MQNTTRFNLFYTIAAILGIILVHEAWMGYQSIKPLAYGLIPLTGEFLYKPFSD
ncbi:hypothetical protein DespoDRAFT_02868 [Desulfobacter postgatei 2ac9]|uniref:Uncharacterized protein n=1 Tax=Desulfobacter postgatei 2ac9 TaxID=879212 RepID=I5B5C3_9BACT|nr:hypothetical protein DespoDRAFT_02868 [Desulfobacter postgatei 2ac9]